MLTGVLCSVKPPAPSAGGVPTIARCQCCGRPLYPDEPGMCRRCVAYIRRLLATVLGEAFGTEEGEGKA